MTPLTAVNCSPLTIELSGCADLIYENFTNAHCGETGSGTFRVRIMAPGIVPGLRMPEMSCSEAKLIYDQKQKV